MLIKDFKSQLYHDFRIWVLGKEIRGIKSLNWNANEITSFADCDTLVVDVASLNEKLLQSIKLEQAQKLFDEIKKRFKTGLEIICITGKSFTTTVDKRDKQYCPPYHTPEPQEINNYFWSPISCNYDETPRGKTLQKVNQNFKFVKYLEGVNEFNISMNGLIAIKNNCQSESNATYAISTPAISDKVEAEHLILSKSDDLLGGVFSGSGIEGKMIFLPPLGTADESINKIFEILGICQQTPTPSWALNIAIPGTIEIEKEIQDIDKEIQEKKDSKNTLCSKLEDLTNFRKLVYATGDELEEIVKNTLELMGLSGIRTGKQGRDDLLFDFNHNDNYSLCSVEVKGTSDSLKLRDLRQSNNWIEDHQEHEQIKAKGLIVCNTFCNDELQKSRTKRDTVSPENLQYAKERKLCILSSVVLLDFCEYILNGNEPDVKKIENAISNTDGILDLESLK